MRGDQVVGLRPDPEHPVSRGHACAKGLHFHRVHHGEERLRRPRVRDEGDVSWDRALSHVGHRLRALLEEHGPASIGVYSGNAAGHALGSVLGLTALVDGLGTPRHYSCLTLDNAPMFPVLEACLGSPMCTFVADYGGSDCIVLVGTDPLSSQPSQAQSHPRGVAELRDRADVLTVVDPRRSLTARHARWHLAPVPGTDVALLAWLLAVVLRARGGGPDALRAALSDVDETILGGTGLELADARALRDRLLSAERPLVWIGLGVLLSGHGTVGYWLALALQHTLGGLDTPGGWRLPRGGPDLVRAARWLGLRGLDRGVRSRVGDYPAVLGTVAAATLADDVLTEGPDRLRALVVVGGNPLVALPDTGRAREALEALDLLVCVDIRRSETGALADVVLPACSWLARDEVAVHTSNQRAMSHVGQVSAVVPPVGEAREDLDIARDLVRAAGRVPFGSQVVDAVVSRLGVGGIGRWALRLLPRRRTGPPEPELAVPWLLDALADVLGEPGPEGGFRLVTSVRPPRTMNSWLRTGRVGPPVVHMHPDDLAGFGPRVRLIGPGGTAEVEVVADPELRRGVVVWPFGWGAHNPNRVLSATDLEEVVGQPRSNGARVALEPLS